MYFSKKMRKGYVDCGWEEENYEQDCAKGSEKLESATEHE